MIRAFLINYILLLIFVMFSFFIYFVIRNNQKFVTFILYKFHNKTFLLSSFRFSLVGILTTIWLFTLFYFCLIEWVIFGFAFSSLKPPWTLYIPFIIISIIWYLFKIDIQQSFKSKKGLILNLLFISLFINSCIFLMLGILTIFIPQTIW